MLTKKPKGTNDILPRDVEKWHFIEDLLRQISYYYGFKEIRTPIFEHTELFIRGVGETTDIVGKEMYTFSDKGDRSITLRPEGTASVVRAFLENKIYAEPNPQKMYYMGPMFRYERPQKGRYKQFNQYGVEFLGSKEALVDAEIISLALEIMHKVGLEDLELHLNTVGCKECKPVHRQALVNFFEDKKEDLCPTCQERLLKNPLRILDCKNPECQKLSEGAPTTYESACEECKTHFDKLKALLEASNIAYIENPKLVRGLDYYTNTAFEIVAKNFAAQGTVCGGGRYNGLVESIGGKDVPGIGFAVGIERILLLLEEKGLLETEEITPDYFLISMGEEAEKQGFDLMRNLRSRGYYVETDYQAKNVKGKFKLADKLNAKETLIIGEDEIAKGTILVKEMATGEQRELNLKEFLDSLREEV